MGRGGTNSARGKRLLILGIAGLSLASPLPACFFGPMDLDPSAVISVLAHPFGQWNDPALETLRTVVLDIRLSRSVLAWLVGAALALAGTVFQGLLRNPLADPFTLGVSTGASFGASLAIFLGLSSGWLSGASGLTAGLGALPPAALLGAFLALGTVLLLARSRGGLGRETLVLAGIVTATFLSALISLLKSLDEESVSAIVFWIMGGFQGRGWGHVILFIPYFLAGLVLILAWSRELDILALGETQARLVGVNASRARLLLLVGASTVTAAAVAVSGVIGFVGLIAPHLLRMLLGAEHRPLLLASALGGGALLVFSDVLARCLLPGGEELPVGVITALLGGPFFCLLLKRGSMKGAVR